MTTDQVVTVIALIGGPAIGVGLSVLLQNRDFVRRERMRLFQTLVAMRPEPVNPERIRALALIDVVFRDKPTVRSKWKDYYETLNNPVHLNNPNAGYVFMTKQNEMLAEMARVLGYGRLIGYEELQRMYAPKAFADNAALQAAMGKEALRVLEASENLGTPRSDGRGGVARRFLRAVFGGQRTAQDSSSNTQNRLPPAQG